jgi:hypothetical protein
VASVQSTQMVSRPKVPMSPAMQMPSPSPSLPLMYSPPMEKSVRVWSQSVQSVHSESANSTQTAE